MKARPDQLVHTVPRRTLVLGALTGLGAVAAAPREASAAPRGAVSVYAAAEWRPLVGHTLATPSGRVLLAAMTEQQDQVLEAYWLRFVSVGGQPLPEQLVLRHPDRGRVHFMVSTAGASGVAVVNRRRS